MGKDKKNRMTKGERKLEKYFQTLRDAERIPQLISEGARILSTEAEDEIEIPPEFFEFNNESNLTDTGPSDKHKQPLTKNKAQDNMSLAVANIPKGPSLPAKPIFTGRSYPIHTKAPKGRRASNGNLSPLGFEPRKPLGTYNDTPKSDLAIPPERTLDDIYREYPDKKPEGGLDPATLRLAASIVLQLVNEATYEWCGKWYPRMNPRKLFDTIRIQDNESGLSSNQCIIPSEAVERGSTAGSMSEMFRQCHSLRPKASDDFQFPGLLKLIDQCIAFMGVLKDTKRQASLQNTRWTFQWIPINLDAKKYPIYRQAQIDLEKLNARMRSRQGGAKARDRHAELEILDAALLEYDTHRQLYRVEVLNGLNILMASTR
ncbi:hypothetical protein F4861DRAFT_371967 [Xylaria intraflava]|nr:hypothetical protein F4861DRAFT_371967 [Xylaria intraflava]